jgi:hypothetical protein
MSENEVSRQSLGGVARKEKLTPEQRSEIAKKAAAARWDKQGRPLPQATHDGVLKIGEAEIACYVLENGQRVISTRGVMKGLGRRWRGRKYAGTQLPVFLEAKNLKPFIDSDLSAVLTELRFRTHHGIESEGFRAEILPMVCDTYLKARDAGALKSHQLGVAKQCEILIRGLAHTGIIALVDEATGYQNERARDALAEILEKFISHELGKWAKRFPDEFYENLFRLKNKKWPPKNRQMPAHVGHWTNNVVYSRLAPGVLAELKEKSPRNKRGNRTNKFHQWLTEDVGHSSLQAHLHTVIAMMRGFEKWEAFEKFLNKTMPKQPQTATERAQKHLKFRDAM